jgi:hypothetical protein
MTAFQTDRISNAERADAYPIHPTLSGFQERRRDAATHVCSRKRSASLYRNFIDDFKSATAWRVSVFDGFFRSMRSYIQSTRINGIREANGDMPGSPDVPRLGW